MALTPPQKVRLFSYLLRSYPTSDLLPLVRDLFDAGFLSAADRRLWFLGRVALVKTRTQALRAAVDGEAATSKVTLDAEIADLTALETDL